MSASQHGHGGSPRSSFVSALPETASFYRSSIEASRSSQRFRDANSRAASVDSTGARSRRDESIRHSSTSGVAGLGTGNGGDDGVDDDIARGLPDSHADADVASVESGFISSRNREGHQPSILPSAAFFAPKKGPRARGSSPLPMTEQHLNDLGTGYGSSGEQETIGYDGRTLGSQNRSDSTRRPHSPFGIASSSSDTGGRDEKYATTAMNRQGSARRSKSGLLSLQHSQGDLKSSRGATPSRRSMLSSMQGSMSRPHSAIAMAEPAASRSPSRSASRRGSRANEKGDKVERKYRAHKGSNRFFLCGLVMTSDDNPLPFLASLAYMVALPVLWFVFVAPYTWRHISPAPVIIFAYVWLVAFSSMCVTAWKDPGVIPRDLDPNPPCSLGGVGDALDPEDPLAVPLPRVIRVRNGTDLKVKWCDTCGTYRPPRSSHCRVCDNCVENIDHHCTFLNTCIGRRNYFTFFAFLIFSLLACFLSIAFCILQLYFVTRPTAQKLPGGGFGEGKDFGEALAHAPLTAVVFLLSVIVMGPLFTLFAYHVRLVGMNRTTVEQIRINTTNRYGGTAEDRASPMDNDDDGKAQQCWHKLPSFCPCAKLGVPGRDPNPFSYRTVTRNTKSVLCRPLNKSWIDRRGRQVNDQRRTNPGWNSQQEQHTHQ